MTKGEMDENGHWCVWREERKRDSRSFTPAGWDDNGAMDVDGQSRRAGVE